MGFAKRLCEVLAILTALVLAGSLVWYALSGFQEQSFEKEGTLVQRNETEEEAYPAFVTNPTAMAFDSDVIQRSGFGL